MSAGPNGQRGLGTELGEDSFRFANSVFEAGKALKMILGWRVGAEDVQSEIHGWHLC